MVKRVLLGVGAVVALAAAFIAFELGVLMGAWQPLLRPHGVPFKAHYVSLDGKWTTWFDCSVNENQNVNHCRAWDDHGRLTVDGDFQLDEGHRMATASELKPTRVIFDSGQAYIICLSGPTGDCARSLIPVKERPK